MVSATFLCAFPEPVPARDMTTFHPFESNPPAHKRLARSS